MADKVDLNSASREELMSVEGIGAAAADAIIRYREEHGGFDSVEDLKNLSGVHEQRFENLHERFTVSGRA